VHAEADRLNRLVGNVLDFSRLENQRPRLVQTAVAVPDLLEQVRSTWQARCQDAGKELAVENGLDEATIVFTDGELVQQVLGNLIDNACKYSRDAADSRVWLRARRGGPARPGLGGGGRGPGAGRGAAGAAGDLPAVPPRPGRRRHGGRRRSGTGAGRALGAPARRPADAAPRRGRGRSVLPPGAAGGGRVRRTKYSVPSTE